MPFFFGFFLEKGFDYGKITGIKTESLRITKRMNSLEKEIKKEMKKVKANELQPNPCPYEKAWNKLKEPEKEEVKE